MFKATSFLPLGKSQPFEIPKRDPFMLKDGVDHLNEVCQLTYGPGLEVFLQFLGELLLQAFQILLSIKDSDLATLAVGRYDLWNPVAHQFPVFRQLGDPDPLRSLSLATGTGDVVPGESFPREQVGHHTYSLTEIDWEKHLP